MLNSFLFEIQCAEELGNFRLADDLDNRLRRMASSDVKSVQKSIEKKFSDKKEVKEVHYSPSQSKFIISADANIPNSLKREIQKLADPFIVSFQYSSNDKFAQHQNIDTLMARPSLSPEERHLDSLNDPIGDYIGLDDLYEMEPSDEDLRFTEEHPADDISSDPHHLDAFLLEAARKHLEKYLK